MRFLISKNQWIRYALSGMISLCIFIGVYQLITAEGAEYNPRFVLMRLEDIGPGGYYATPDGLGKLRTVLEFLQQQHVHYSLAVIPRWLNFSQDGSRYDRSLDQMDLPYIQSFNKLLSQAVRNGAALGMHGYTHQAGETRRDDGQHASGLGNEFNVTGLPETATTAFAEERVNEGLRIFQRAGFAPEFWEAPHYHTVPEQDRVFRAYFGLLYQPDMKLNPDPPAAQYENDANTGYGAPSLGSVHVPTPMTYIADNKNENVILKQLGKTNRINSFFYHPFLEFKYLVPVVDGKGSPVIRDGLPEYKYPAENKSTLQKLLVRLSSLNYQFYSIHDYVPFTPAQRVEVGHDQPANLQIGDVAGRGQADIVAWNRQSGQVMVTSAQFNTARNAVQPAPQAWATIAYANGAALTLNGTNGVRKKGLWVVHPNGKLESYASDGGKFVLNRTWTIPAERWTALNELRMPGGDCVLAGLSQDQKRLLGVYVHNGTVKPIKPYLFKSDSTKELLVRNGNKTGGQSIFIGKKDSSQGLQIDFDPAAMEWKTKKTQLNIPTDYGQLRFGDFNGDGKEDILRWDPAHLKTAVYLQTDDNEYKFLSSFGPWGKADGRMVVADFDENGKSDVAIIGNKDGFMDVALSFQSKDQ